MRESSTEALTESVADRELERANGSRSVLTLVTTRHVCLRVSDGRDEDGGTQRTKGERELHDGSPF